MVFANTENINSGQKSKLLEGEYQCDIKSLPPTGNKSVVGGWCVVQSDFIVKLETRAEQQL